MLTRGRWLRSLIKGGGDPAAILAGLKAEGYDIELDTRTSAQVAHDKAHGFGRDYHPSDYVFNVNTPATRVEGSTIEQQASFVNAAKTWSAEMNLSPDIAKTFVEMVVETAIKLDKMKPAERALWDKENEVQYQARRKGTVAEDEANIKTAMDGMSEPSKAFFEKMVASGALKHWALRSLLAAQLQHIARWAKSYPED